MVQLSRLLDQDGRSVARREVAEAIGCSPQRLSACVTGERPPSLEIAFRLLALVEEVSVAALWTEEYASAQLAMEAIRAGKRWIVAPASAPVFLPHAGTPELSRWRLARAVHERAPKARALLGLLVMLTCDTEGWLDFDLLDAAHEVGGTVGEVKQALDMLVEAGFLVVPAVRDVRPDRRAVAVNWAMLCPTGVAGTSRRDAYGAR